MKQFAKYHRRLFLRRLVILSRKRSFNRKKLTNLRATWMDWCYYIIQERSEVNISQCHLESIRNWHLLSIFALRLRGNTAHDCLPRLLEWKRDRLRHHFGSYLQFLIASGINVTVIDIQDASKICKFFHFLSLNENKLEFVF